MPSDVGSKGCGRAGHRNSGRDSMELTTSKAGETEERTGNNCSSVTLPTKKTTKDRWPEIRARSFFTAREGGSSHDLSSHNLLSREEQRQLHWIATLIDYRRGGITIYSQGEEARSVYFIDEGIIRISR